MLYENILETIGQTPLVKIQNISKDLEANLYGKCEFFNPGGSIKDRIAFNMIKEAEKEGRIKPGDTLIEPTSGNTGIGLALVGAILGYKVLIVMPEKMSQEKQILLESLGAEIIRTPTEVASEDPRSHISIAKKLEKEKRGLILNQYNNINNYMAHYHYTSEEILKSLKGQVDMIVAGAGTGGTLTGLSKKIKKQCPHCKIVGVDPVGSILAGEEPSQPYEVEGIGYDFIPEVLHRDNIDKWVKTKDKDSFNMARRLIKEEGLLCGGSSGAAMWAALQEAKQLKENQNCVVILPDGIRNYMSKFPNDEWLKKRRHLT